MRTDSGLVPLAKSEQWGWEMSEMNVACMEEARKCTLPVEKPEGKRIILGPKLR
jgi:hypothetical protein